MVSTTSQETSANTEQLSQDIVQAVQAILDNPKLLETVFE